MGIRGRIKRWVETYKLYFDVTNLVPISRRYFIIGYFDGVITIQGLILGAYLSGKASSELIISAGIATAIALGISSGWGAYEAERMEQRVARKIQAKAMLKDVGGIIKRAHNFAIFISSLVHAVSPIIGAIFPILVFAFLPFKVALPISIGLGFGQLFAIGVFMGKTSGINIIFAGLRLTLAGVLTLVAVTLLSPTHIS